MDQPGTHQRWPTIENGCIGVFTIRDGKIQEVREYMDTLYAREVAFSDHDTRRPAVAGGE